MLLVIGTFRLAPENLPRARPVMARMITASRAEDGSEEYSYSEDVLDPGLIHVKELWRDQATLDRHLEASHLRDWRSAWADLGIGERNLRVYSVGDPKPT
ncbi:MAG: antibiotic biosynthesis monooxygenase [Rhodobacteraceae bacterium]|nr:antibiotic biosynthesis monooxygenase [Paracoccaceae bacterium]